MGATDAMNNTEATEHRGIGIEMGDITVGTADSNFPQWDWVFVFPPVRLFFFTPAVHV